MTLRELVFLPCLAIVVDYWLIVIWYYVCADCAGEETELKKAIADVYISKFGVCGE